MFELDGSNYRPVGSTAYGSNNMGLRWAPDGSRVVFHSPIPGESDPYLGLFTLAPNGTYTQVVESPPQTYMMQPQSDASGEWLYFVRTSAFQRAEIWRVRWDGTGLELAGRPAADDERDLQPSPNADGSLIAHLSTRGLLTGITLRILERASGSTVNLNLAVLRPAWSPRGDEIAFYEAARVGVIRPNGSGQIPVGPALPYDAVDGQLDWSPDGEWIVACAYAFHFGYEGTRAVVILNRATGELLPLAYTAQHNLCEASWRPQ
jgi:Tol biopolymer transport system component